MSAAEWHARPPAIPAAAEDPDFSRWGFAHTPSLRALQQQQQQHDASSSRAEATQGWLEALHTSRVFTSPFGVEAMGKALGFSDLLVALSGTLSSSAATADEAADAVQLVHNAIDIAWSQEAVRQGVAAAKSGSYADAMHCYDKALCLWPYNADALVARGAARANRKQYSGAMEDFQAALAVRPDDANAAAYLQATQAHVARDNSAAAAAGGVEQQGLLRGPNRATKTAAIPSGHQQLASRGSRGPQSTEDTAHKGDPCPSGHLEQQPAHRPSKRHRRDSHSNAGDPSNSSSSSSDSSGSDSSSGGSHRKEGQQHGREPGGGYTASDVRAALASLGHGETEAVASGRRQRAKQKHKKVKKQHRKHRSKHKSGSQKSKKQHKHKQRK